MKKGIILGALIALALPFAALAQGGPPQSAPPAVSAPIPDVPAGYPYRVGSAEAVDAHVPLRDYLSSRIDQLAVQVEQLRAEMMQVMDERDQRYAQRFQAQQEAVNAALQAAKEAVANALSAAKEAVTKAETAVEKRFEGVNEFRQTLTDQALTFLNKDAAEARFTSLEEDTRNLAARMNDIASRAEGGADLWVIILGVLGGAVLVIGVFLTIRRDLRSPGK